MQFNFLSLYWIDELRVQVDWTLPFLPRIGERIGGWIWINEGRWDQAEIEKMLTSEGEEYWASCRAGGMKFKDWLYEVSMECKTVFGISYSKFHGSPPGEIIVDIWVNETGELEEE